MPRISRLGRSRASGALRDGFERMIAQRGNLPNMQRVLAHPADGAVELAGVYRLIAGGHEDVAARDVELVRESESD